MTAKAIDTFKRVEDKYVMTRAQMAEILARMQGRIKEDQYFKYTVHSIYFDSADCDLAIRSLMKPNYKMKLRLRSYGDPEEGSPVFLETKKKWEKIVYKRRIVLDQQEAFDYLKYGKSHHVSNNTADEIDYIMKYYQPMPKVFVAYDRECYSSLSESDVRITFDSNIRYRLHDLSLYETGDEIDLSEGRVTMEIKAMDRYPLWLTKILSEMKLYKGSFSKYGTIYRNNMQELRGSQVHVPQYSEAVRKEGENTVCSIQL